MVFHCKLSIIYSTLFSTFLFVSSYSPFIIMLSIIGWTIFFYIQFPSHLPFLLEHPSIGSSFLANVSANFFSFSFSDPALFFLVPLFLAQLLFLFVCPFYTLHPSPYPHLKCFQSFLLTPSQCPILCTIQRYNPHKALH